MEHFALTGNHIALSAQEFIDTFKAVKEER
jgi:hypothetical protein